MQTFVYSIDIAVDAATSVHYYSVMTYDLFISLVIRCMYLGPGTPVPV